MNAELNSWPGARLSIAAALACAFAFGATGTWNPESALAFGGYSGGSADLGATLFKTDRPLLPEDHDVSFDLYLRSDRGLEIVSQAPVGGNASSFDCGYECSVYDEIRGYLGGDGRVYFHTSERLTSDDIDEYQDVYSFHEGQAQLISVGPAGGQGTACPQSFNNDCHVSLIGGAPPRGAYFETPEPLVREDADGYDPDLYWYVDGDLKLVSASDGLDSGVWAFGTTPEETSEDGSLVTFEHPPFDIWIKDFATGKLSRLIPFAGLNGWYDAFVEDVSPEGNRIVFETEARLAASDDDSEPDVYVKEDDEFIHVSRGLSVSGIPTPAGFSAASADTSVIVFATREGLVEGDRDNQADIYRFAGGEATLLSGPPNGIGASDCARDTVTTYQGCAAHFDAMSQAGDRVVFSTREPLLPEDRDAFGSYGTVDIYEWTSSGLRLLTGDRALRSGFGAEFLGASRDARRVFFETQESLIEGDADDPCLEFEPEESPGEDIYMHDGQQTVWVTNLDAFDPGQEFFFEDVSDDGRRVVMAIEPGLFENQLRRNERSHILWEEGETRPLDFLNGGAVTTSRYRTPLRARFAFSPYVPTVNRQVTFDGGSSCVGGAEVRKWKWDLDDDGKFDDAAGRIVRTSFGEAGRHPVKLRVTDSTGERARLRRSITVGANRAPDADFERSAEDFATGQVARFDSSESFDDYDEITSREWDLDGDGEFDDATGRFSERAFDEAGSKTVRLRITDAAGASDTASQSFSVQANRLPELDPRVTRLSHLRYRFEAHPSDADGRITTTDWDLDGDGAYDDASGSVLTHEFPREGDYEAAVRAIDDSGVEVSARYDQISIRDKPLSVYIDRAGGVSVGGTLDLRGETRGAVQSLAWDLDDDGSFDDAQGEEASVVARDVNAQKISVKATAPTGETATDSEVFYPFERNPQAVVSLSPRNPHRGQTVTFDSTNSYDLDGRIVSREWDFDGQGGIDASGVTAQTSYGTNGVKHPKLVLTDDDGNRHSTEFRVVVGSLPTPRIEISPEAPRAREPVTFDTRGSSDRDGTIVDRELTITKAGQGGFTSSEPVVARTFDKSGEYRVTLTVTDNDGRKATTARYFYVHRREK